LDRSWQPGEEIAGMQKKLVTDPIIETISLKAPWRLVETFSTMPRWKPKDVNKSADVIVKMLRQEGVPVTIHKPTVYLSIPFGAEVRIASDAVVMAKPPAYSPDCRRGIEGELVYVPATYSRSVGTLFAKNQEDASLSARERLQGKIVVSEGFAFPGKMLEFEQKGATAAIAVNPGADIHWGICTSIWGTPDLDDLPRKPGIPVVAVNNPDGRKLIALAKRGSRATIVTAMEEGWYQQKVPVVEIRGQREPEKFVLVHGHYDSWDVGVGDNATGNATLLELARVFWKHRKSLRRSVRIAWWPGHSTGRYAGSTWYADAFAIDLDENCVAQVNCDSPGCRWATVFKDVSWMPETEAYVKSAIKAVTGLDSHGERPHRAGDYAFNNIGISSFFMLSSTMPDALRAEKGYYTVGGCGGNIAWHTEHDLIDIADKDILLRDIKVYAQAVLGVANAKILPFDWTATTKEFAETVERYQEAAGSAFDLGPAKRAIQELDRAARSFRRAVQAGKIDADQANAVIMGLARILVPINSTREARFRHDPALPIPPLPTLSVADDIRAMPKELLGFAKIQLARGQNRVVAAMRAAIKLIATAT
jgi:N-acetylated-alpha-linked acidic dipeptidase